MSGNKKVAKVTTNNKAWRRDMKLARFAYQGTTWLGQVNTDTDSIDGLIEESGDEDLAIRFMTATPEQQREASVKITLPLSDVQLLPPIRRPSKNIICIGKNYAAHAAEFSGSGYDSSSKSKDDVIPDSLIAFSKSPGTMIGAFDEILPPWNLSLQIDYEAELGVIIGRDGRDISRENVYDYIWGYTIINDVTARDLQSQHQQWLIGKSMDTFCPIGPWIVSADEVDPTDLDISCWVNDELRQQANTRDLIFDIPSIVSTVSGGMTLRAGDIISTGTPAGVGIGFNPPKFLKAGDNVRIAIKSIGEINNTLR
jgi:2-keto-4-pentenoate hydratase/2-oxohepta-3-ene-1,7-dioic acid hydratase in catechol pathway